MEYKAVNLQKKFEIISEFWEPKIIAQMNDYHLKLAKISGDFVWHSHSETDEVFMVLEGKMSIEFRDGEVTLKNSNIFVVPKGVEHRPHSDEECKIMLIEPKDTINTGDAGGEMTAENDIWI